MANWRDLGQVPDSEEDSDETQNLGIAEGEPVGSKSDDFVDVAPHTRSPVIATHASQDVATTNNDKQKALRSPIIAMETFAIEGVITNDRPGTSVVSPRATAADMTITSSQSSLTDLDELDELVLVQPPDIVTRPAYRVAGAVVEKELAVATSETHSPVTIDAKTDLEASHGTHYAGGSQDLVATPQQPLNDTSPKTVEGDASSQMEYARAPTPQGSQLNDRIRNNTQAPQLVRSLRPRKPIQQHPYQLENAMYAMSMKSHGVKPIRFRNMGQYTNEQHGVRDEDFMPDETNTHESVGTDNSTQQRLATLSSVASERSAAAVETHQPELEQRESRASSEENVRDNIGLPSLSQLANMSQVLQPSVKSTRKRKAPSIPEPVLGKKLKIPSPLLDASPTVHEHRYANIYNLSSSPVPSVVHDVHAASLSALPPEVSARQLNGTEATSPGSLPVLRNRRAKHRSRSGIDKLPTAPPDKSLQVDLTADQAESEPPVWDRNDNTESSCDSDVVRREAKRIRGVLPASWVRLDRSNVNVSSGLSHQLQRHNRLSLGRTQRRGVAQPIHRQSTEDQAPPVSCFDDEAEDNSTSQYDNDCLRNTVAYPVADDSIRAKQYASYRRSTIVTDDEERVTNSDMEGVVHQSSPKRRRSSGVKKRPRNTNHAGIPRPRKEQTSITHHVITSQRRGRKTTHHSRPRLVIPPRLSILDVAPPAAPAFIRVAARTARHRADKGRSSPRLKRISLATRSDNLDAQGALRDWKNGRVVSGTREPEGEQAMSSGVAEHLSRSNSGNENAAANNNAIPDVHARHARRSNTNPALLGLVESLASIRKRHLHVPSRSVTNLPAVTSARPSIRRLANAKPAILEVEAGQSLEPSRQFEVCKRAMDATYHGVQSGPPAPLSILEMLTGRPYSASSQAVERHQVSTAKPPGARRRRKRRFRPRQIDVRNPKYARANDPLPDGLPLDFPELEVVARNDNELVGLGPYGSSYTHSFEVFPFDLGVYFHHSTLIGSGRLKRAIDTSTGDYYTERSPSCFHVDLKTLSWALWNETVSSELGILMDWMLHKVQAARSQQDSEAMNAKSAALFIIVYCQESLRFVDADGIGMFLSRFTELCRGFLDRLKQVPNVESQVAASVLTRLLLALIQVLNICHQDTSYFTHSLELEDVLRFCATELCAQLLTMGLETINDLYTRLQTHIMRERGIRASETAAESWVALMHVMSAARIPRCGFWDVVALTLQQRQELSTCTDVRLFERWWRILFTLLPLGEINSEGVVICGRRFSNPFDGWRLPQLLLKRVLGLYQANSRQPPSFNAYVGALVSRCHYLVSEWGWRGTSTTVATIFDFFTANNLCHLRNEQVEHSPRFLEDYQSHVTIDPNDCVFHRFLKLLALILEQMCADSLAQEAGNLLIRMTPNCFREFDRERPILLRELAALRNHHDLLCTLYIYVDAKLRLPVTHIQRLVTLNKSHHEACIINVESWQYLACFMVRQSPFDASRFDELARWYRDLHQSSSKAFWSIVTVHGGSNVSLAAGQDSIQHAIHQQNILKNLRVSLALLRLVSEAAMSVFRAAYDVLQCDVLFNLLPSSHVLDDILQQEHLLCTASIFKSSLQQVVAVILAALVAYTEVFVHPLFPGGRIGSMTFPTLDHRSRYLTNFVSYHAPPRYVLLIQQHEQYFGQHWSIAALLVRVSSHESYQPNNTSNLEARKLARQAVKICGCWVALQMLENSCFDISGHVILSQMALPPLHEQHCTERQSVVSCVVSILQLVQSCPAQLLSFSLQVLMTALVLPSPFKDEEGTLLKQILKLHPALCHMNESPLLLTRSYEDAHNTFAQLIRYMSSYTDSIVNPHAKRVAQQEFALAINCAMKAMKRDFESNTDIHRPTISEPESSSLSPSSSITPAAAFLAFSRQILVLIRNWGQDINVDVDPFFLHSPRPDRCQIPATIFSPDPDDPTLFRPQLDRYIRRIQNGSSGAETQCFYFLYNSVLGFASTMSAAAVEPEPEACSADAFWTLVTEKLSAAGSRGSKFRSFIINVFVVAIAFTISPGTPQGLFVLASMLGYLDRLLDTAVCEPSQSVDIFSGESAGAIARHLIIVAFDLLKRFCSPDAATTDSIVDASAEALRVSVGILGTCPKYLTVTSDNGSRSETDIEIAIAGLLSRFKHVLDYPLIMANQSSGESHVIMTLLEECRDFFTSSQPLPPLPVFHESWQNRYIHQFALQVRADIIAGRRKWKTVACCPHLEHVKGLGWAISEIAASVQSYAKQAACVKNEKRNLGGATSHNVKHGVLDDGVEACEGQPAPVSVLRNQTVALDNLSTGLQLTLEAAGSKTTPVKQETDNDTQETNYGEFPELDDIALE